MDSYFSQKISNNNIRRKDEYLNHFVQNLSIYLENFISVVVSLIIIFLINWKMALSFILVSLFSILISQLPGKYFTKMTNNLTTVSQVYLREISDFLKSFEQSKLLQIENFIKNKCQDVNQHFETIRRQYFFSKESSQIFTQIISLPSQMFCMVIGIYFIWVEQITLGNLIASIQILNGVFHPLQVILHQHNQMTSTKKIRSRLNEIFDFVENNNCELANLEIKKLNVKILV
ncbi:ABC transporter ATP-binding protein [Streptococcus bovimastitidis]|uniref:ABC transporter ATP-binding protein n=1 Tax=Streptococcus bovimastitidis TaxID=1856638 RepID=UPI0013F4DFCC|nr:ABC transporter ATP-binding protein [Streptococcus bovimastitidis]